MSGRGDERPEGQIYPFPIQRSGQVHHFLLNLPVDLTLEEARRIGQFLESIAIDTEEKA